MKQQKCRICGCTEDHACVTPAGPCSWYEVDLCSNPACLESSVKIAEKFIADAKAFATGEWRTDAWKDPRVKEALDDGRTADDIYLLECPKCHIVGYYNQGSYFTCLACNQSYYACGEDETAPANLPCINASEVRTQAGWTDATEEGP